MQYDFIITNGRLLDGSGSPETSGDIGILGDKIETIGDLSQANAAQRIDATNQLVCPGFIDTHSHSDAYLLIEPSAASKLYQGVTTEICGNCGASAAPLLGHYNMPTDWRAQLDKYNVDANRTDGCTAGDWEQNDQSPPTFGCIAGVPPATAAGRTAGDWELNDQSPPASAAKRTAGFQPAPPPPAPWSTVADYRDRFEAAQPAVNAALLIGHNTLHAGLCGYEPRAATPDELRTMIHALEQAFDEGAIGLSSGLIYPPGSAVPKEELIALARIVARHNGRYTTHMRSETAQLLEAIDEAIEIAERSGARLQISHLKTGNQASWHKLPAALERIHTAAERIPLGADRYPYLAGCTELDIVLPSWASHGGNPAILERLRTPATRHKIREELLTHPADYWDNVMIGSTTVEELKGEYLIRAAEHFNMNIVDALLHLIDSDNLTTGGIFFGMSEENMWTILGDPLVSIGSDASLRAPWGPLSSDHPHPRAYGSFTRFLRAALSGQSVPLPEAIRKMTGLPAAQFGLTTRGLLAPGKAADIVIINPKTLKEHTSYKDPHHLSEGVRHSWINGAHTLNNGKLTAHRAGQLINA